MTNLQQLLALHYAYPLTLNKLQRLLHIIQTLDELESISISKLARIIDIKEQTAHTVKAIYTAVHQIDLVEQYEAAGIEVAPTPSVIGETLIKVIKEKGLYEKCKTH